MIILYKGSRGRGKNLCMVKDAFKFYKDGYKIISNFSLSFAEKIDSETVLNLDKNSNLYNCVLVLDEIQIFFDSRKFKDNIKFSNFIQQSRKRNIHILAAAQFSNTVDLRFRQHIDIIAFPYYDADFQICKVDYYDLTMLEDLDFNIESLKPVSIFFDATQVFDMYDTYEMLI